MLSEVKGLVLKTTDINDSDRMVTLYTDSQGLVSAMAGSARSLKSRKMAATMQFCYSSFVLYTQGDKTWIREASLIESFFGIRDSLEGLALASYVVEAVSAVGTAEPDKDILRLALNTLYAISVGKYELDKVKGAFEIRLVSMLGFMPDVSCCCRCSAAEGDFFLDVMAGAIECFSCHDKAQKAHESLTDPHEASVVRIISEAARIALMYCIHCPLEKLFSFNLQSEDLGLFSSAAESYILNHLERGFNSLDFYNEVKG